MEPLNEYTSEQRKPEEPRAPALPHSQTVRPTAGCLAPLGFHFLFCKVEEEEIKSLLVLKFSLMPHQILIVSGSLFPLFPEMIFCCARWEQMG